MKFSLGVFERAKDLYAHGNEPEALHALADLYWRSLLLLAFAALVGVFLWGTRTVTGVLGDLEAPPRQFPPPRPPLDRVALSATLEALRARAARYDVLKTSGSAVSDPSR